jgi:hypothetical protein
LSSKVPSRSAKTPRLLLNGWTALFLLTLLYATTIRAALLNRPFSRDFEGVSAYYGMLARGYFRYDWSQTLGVPACSLGESPAKPILYANHPPLAFLDVALVYWLFGYNGSFATLPPDWQLRLAPACFCIACIVLLYNVLGRRANPRTAAIAAALFAAMPITIVYGGHADVVNPQLVFFCLLTIAAYQNLHTGPTARNAAWVAIAFIPAGLSDWIAFYLLPVLALHWLFTKRLGDWQFALPLCLTGVGVFAAVYCQISLARHQWNWFADLFLRRSSAGLSDGGIRFTFGKWVRDALIGFNSREHTPLLLILAAVWIGLEWWNALSRRRAKAASTAVSPSAQTFCRLVLAWGLLHVFIGRQGVYNHYWWWWPLTPGIAIAAALLLDKAATAIESSGISSRYLNTGIVAFLTLFAAWTVRAELPGMLHAPDLAFSAQDYGRAIRLATPPGRAVILADSDRSVCLWYYADRPILFDVWDADTLDADLTLPRSAELPWTGYFQPLSNPPAAIVLPAAYARTVPSFVIYLDAHYTPVRLPAPLDSEFIAFDLTTPAGPHFASIAPPRSTHSSGVSPSRTANLVSSATE